MSANRGTAAAVLGGAGMYFLDPSNGRRRRARARDVLDHAIVASKHGLDVAARDAWNRMHGVVARVRGVAEARPDDDVLAERVRAKLGRLSQRAHVLGVTCHSGRVTLSGPILASETTRVLSGTRAVQGVVELVDHLERHGTADIPALQTPVRRPAWGPPQSSSYWPPATRLAVGGAGATIAILGVLRGGLLGTIAGFVGGAAVARSITNADLGALFGLGNHHGRGVSILKTMTIHASPDEVFAYFTGFENFPRFMRHVVEVTKVDDNRWHWKVRGAAGMPFEWDAMVLDLVPAKFVAWATADDASVRHSGSAMFERVAEGTRATIRLSYDPPFGIAGHDVAKLLGADAKREIDDDLLRLKSLVETGRASGVSREELAGVPMH